MDEKTMQNKEKVEKYEQRMICLIGGATAGLIYLVGYSMGYGLSIRRANKGFAILFKEHPEVQEPFISALTDCMGKKMLGKLK